MTLRRFTADCVPFWAIVGLISRALSGLNRAWTSRRPRRQCAGVLADGFCFIYHWLCTEKPPTRRRTCRRRLFYMPLAMHREAANARAHLQTASALHTTDYAQRSRQCADALADGASTAAMPHAFSTARSSCAPMHSATSGMQCRNWHAAFTDDSSAWQMRICHVP